MASFFVKFKILLVCLLLLAMGAVSVWVVLAQVGTLLEPDDLVERIGKRNAFVNAALFHMYRAESDGVQLLLGNGDCLPDYEADLDNVRAALDSLKSFTADSLQIARLDSVAVLFSLKESTLYSMAENLDLKSYNGMINEKISGLMPDSAELKKQLVASTNTVVRHDTVLTKRKTGNFFNRVKNVFKKSHTDSTVIITSNVAVDSTHVAMADSINAVLGGLQKTISDLHSGAVAKQRELWAEWAKGNSEINALILRLIKDFDADETVELLGREAKKDSENDATVKLLAAMAIAAILAVLFFLWIIWRDLEKSNKYKKELERINKYNLDLLDARENMMLAITHDIKAPLGSIIGYTDLLARIANDNRQKLYVSSIRDSSDLLLSLVTDLLEFYRLDSDKEELKIMPFNVVEFFNSVYQVFFPVADGKKLALSLDVRLPDNFCVESDPIKMRQIVNNLINNAIKFTDSGGVGIAVSFDSGGSLVICISDTGRGISDSEKERMFGAFVRVGSSQGVQGFGLGLSIVEKTVRLMGGEIDVKSEVGVGTEFRVSIPVGIVDADAVETDKSADVELSGLAGCKLLLVDDDELQMNLVSEICRNGGIVADKCQYPSYAAKMVSESRYDIVVTDIQMPEMNGFEVMAAVKAVDGGVPVVAVTARLVDKDEYVKAGFADVLTKPFKEHDFMSMVARVLGGAEIKENKETADGRTGLSAMLEFAGDDKDARNEILQSFVRQTEENLELLEKARQDGDCGAIMSLCHKMMPIFAMMGEDDIVFILRKYESGIGDISAVVPEDIDELKSKVKNIVDLAKEKII